MESLEGQKNLICRRYFLPYDLSQDLAENSLIYNNITKGKSLFEKFYSVRQQNVENFWRSLSQLNTEAEVTKPHVGILLNLMYSIY